jgi:hypothetical protein
MVTGAAPEDASVYAPLDREVRFALEKDSRRMSDAYVSGAGAKRLNLHEIAGVAADALARRYIDAGLAARLPIFIVVFCLPANVAANARRDTLARELLECTVTPLPVKLPSNCALPAPEMGGVV